jgi:hypothetical protein
MAENSRTEWLRHSATAEGRAGILGWSSIPQYWGGRTERLRRPATKEKAEGRRLKAELLQYSRKAT